MGEKPPSRLIEEIAAFANKRPTRLMFQDEARFGCISDTRSCWHKKPHRPQVRLVLTHQYTYAYGAVSPLDGRFDSLMSPHVNGECMQLFLDEVAARYPQENILMVLDGAGWHKNQTIQPPQNLRLIFLPPYSPELSPQEHAWDELREKYFHNRAFDSLDALENQLCEALKQFELDPNRLRSMTGWQWIINCVSNCN